MAADSRSSWDCPRKNMRSSWLSVSAKSRPAITINRNGAGRLGPRLHFYDQVLRIGVWKMIAVDKKLIPQEILKDSVILHLASAYFSIGKRLEQKTQCSPTRGFIMATLRGG